MASTDELMAELVKRGATMEQVALLKDPTANTPDEALSLLQAGNARFFSGQPQRVFSDVNSRRAQIIAQTPFAVVLGCADSRVPIELVFDQGPGDLFSIRVAGNVVEAGTLGSIQYAIRHLKVHLVVVLGHEGCGAVAASLLTPQERAVEPLHVRFLLDAIAPALEGIASIQDRKARMREAVVLNVRRQKAILEQDDVVREAIESGRVKVVGAFYEIGSGAVDFLEG
ncbi:carbonic anhydrase 2 [Abditibacteriota bacterium]|nr:carbonic anhydrase 2 [Abditibacteriota bacterium]